MLLTMNCNLKQDILTNMVALDDTAISSVVLKEKKDRLVYMYESFMQDHVSHMDTEFYK